ncbi:MAG: sigma-54-dependent Fis family transcriptional regulator [Planctomycetota bacterium]
MLTPTSGLISAAESRRLLLTMSQQRSVTGVLSQLVSSLHQNCGAALARVWLLEAPPEPATVGENAPNTSAGTLVLRASAGTSLEGTSWSRLDGEFSRMPVGFGKIGHIAATRQPVEEQSIKLDSPWISRPDWIRQEQIQGLIGQPLICQDELLGVLAVFTRASPSDDDLLWLRAFADYAASAVSNQRAFEQIQQLQQQLELENESLRNEVKNARPAGEIVGHSPALQLTLRRVQLVASTDATVLIEGESGTGKELVARAVHDQSRRRDRPLVTVNCAAIPPDLFESEFFGHVAGSFSGATRDRLGRFQLADRGTLMLDEVGEVPLNMQGKLLRVLEQGTFERVGDERTRTVDVRIIAATNRDLQAEVAAGRFRKDLFYRLSVFVIPVAPLRERVEDIIPLTQHFLGIFSRKYRVRQPELTRQQLDMLTAYEWPGNVRELRNVIERAVITSRSTGTISGLEGNLLPSAGEKNSSKRKSVSASLPLLTEAGLRDLERRNLIAVLKHTQWKIAGPGGAAEFLGIHPATLASRLRTFQISRSMEHESRE